VKCIKEGVEELKAELFFFVVAGEEDLAVLVEAVDQPLNGVGHGRRHASEGYVRGTSSQADARARRRACGLRLTTNGCGGRGDAEDVGTDGGKDRGVESAGLPLLQEHLGFARKRRAGYQPAVREAEELPGIVEVTSS